jgi:hypothetical protein
MGEAKIRSPLGRSSFFSEGGGGADFSALGSSALGGSGAFSEAEDAGFSDAASSASFEAPERSSPSSARMAIAAPTLTFLVPSADYRTCQLYNHYNTNISTYNDFRQNTFFLSLHVNRGLVRFLRTGQ